MEFEDVLLEVGGYGKYQRNLILFFLVPATIVLPLFTMSIFCMASLPDHWCYVPEVALSNLSIEMQKSLIRPPDNPTCAMYNVSYTDLLSSGVHTVPNDSTTIPCTQGFQYDQTDYDYTASTQFNLVCEDLHFISLIFTIGNLGRVIFTPLYGALSDRMGRRNVLFITLTVALVTYIAMIYMPTFATFLLLKAIHGTIMPTLYHLTYIIVLELVDPNFRTRVSGLSNVAWATGACLVPLVAYLSRNWFTLGLATGCLIPLYFCYWWFVPESPRWLVSQNRYIEALEIMMKIGKTNGKPQDKAILLRKLQNLGDKMKKEKDVVEVENRFTDLVKYPGLRRNFIIITFAWIANITAYYGLQLTVYSLAGSEFLNFFLLCLMEIPAYVVSWYAMKHFGRRWSAVAALSLGGIMILLACIESDVNAVVCSIMGKFFTSCSFMITYLQGSELYPTVIRFLGIGLSYTIALCVTFAVPYIMYLSVYEKWIPFLIVGSTCLIAGILVSFLPETLNENLPQTVSDAEVFGRNQKYFSWNRQKKSNAPRIAEDLSVRLEDLQELKEKLTHVEGLNEKEENSSTTNSKLHEQKIT